MGGARTVVARLTPLLAITALLAIGGCGRDGGVVAPPPPDDVTVTDPPHIYASLRSGISDETRIVIRSQAGWQSVWDGLLHGGAAVAPPLPEVDFASSVVVVAAMGTRERAGFDIGIAGYERSSGVTRVTVRSVAPSSACPSSPVLTTPAAAAAVAASAVVTFVELSEEAPCPPS